VAPKIWNQQVEDHKKIPETMEKDSTTISCRLLWNGKLKSRLGKLQDGFIRLSINNMELTSALQL
jgi:hypothetical protein